MVHVMGYDRFLGAEIGEKWKRGTGGTYGHLSEISSKDAGDVVGCVLFALPVEGFSVLGNA